MKVGVTGAADGNRPTCIYGTFPVERGRVGRHGLRESVFEDWNNRYTQCTCDGGL